MMISGLYHTGIATPSPPEVKHPTRSQGTGHQGQDLPELPM